MDDQRRRDEARSSFHGCRGAWNATCAGTTPRSIGKSGGENVRAIESSRLPTVDGGPDVERDLQIEERCEKTEPLDVIKVEMRQQEVDVAYSSRRGRRRDL